MKILKFGFKVPNCGILGFKFENAIVIIEISALEYAYLQKFGQG